MNPGTTCRPAQMGQPCLPETRAFGVICQVCPKSHFHEMRTFEPGVTVSGPREASSHSAARSGYREARSLKPGATRRLAQVGHPFPSTVRRYTAAFQTCPSAQRHDAFVLDVARTSCGERSSSHSTRKSGNCDARSLKPGRTTLPAQTGQPVPETREYTVARHSCPSSQRQSALYPEPGVTVLGSRDGSAHCAASSGRAVGRKVFTQLVYH